MKHKNKTKKPLMKISEEQHSRVAKLSKSQTERRKTDDMLRKNEQRYHTIIHTALDGFWINDMKGRIVDVNDSYCQMMGYTREELLSMSISDVKAVEDTEETARHMKKILEQGYDRFETRHRHKDGKVINIEVSATYSDEAGGQLVVFLRDITERKRTEQAMIKTKKFTESMISSAMDGIVVFDLIGNFVQFNDAFLRMTGYSNEELKKLNFRQITPEKWRVKDAAQFKKLLLEDELHTHYEKEFIRKDGSPFPATLSMSLLYEKNEPFAIMAIVRDETERKRVEEELKKFTEELEHSNKELEQFAYVASHDLQEPLRMVASYTQLLEKRYKDKLDTDAHEFIEYAVEGATRMQDLINGLLAYSRVGTRGKEFELTNCEEIVQKVIKNLQVLIEENSAKVTYNSLPAVMADDLQMIQLFQNLISNAIKFQGEKSPEVKISAKQKGKEWIFSVRDNGIGIDSQYKDRIFTIFQRLNDRTKYHGVGIGLTICKKIIDRHNGRIWVESKPAKGSTFYFTIPVRSKR